MFNLLFTALAVTPVIPAPLISLTTSAKVVPDAVIVLLLIVKVLPPVTVGLLVVATAVGQLACHASVPTLTQVPLVFL